MAIASLSGVPAAARPTHSLSAAELLAWRRRLLTPDGSGTGSSAGLDWLLDLAGGVSWSELQSLWLHPQQRVELRLSLEELEQLWRRHRLDAVPLQYLVGLCPWRDLELSVAPGVLIPRQETERLLELALSLAPLPEPGRPLCWADLGTGSGCLAVALARALPGSIGLAVEASAEALPQAQANLEALLPPASLLEWPDAGASQADPAAGSPGPEPLLPGVRLRQGCWWQPIEPWWGRLQLVVSNPPTSPRPCWRSWIRWCVITNPRWLSMEAPTGCRRFVRSLLVPRRPWLPVACCCSSITTTRAKRCWPCWRLPAWRTAAPTRISRACSVLPAAAGSPEASPPVMRRRHDR